MTRRRLALGIALAVLVVVGAVWWATLPRPGITKANCARIKPGMRLEEVEAILGGPPRVERQGRTVEFMPTARFLPAPFDGLNTCYWENEQGAVMVHFTDNAFADAAAVDGVRYTPAPFSRQGTTAHEHAGSG